MKKKPTTYERRGVSAQKRDVHEATKNLDKGLFPGAFCKIHADPDSPHYCRILHPDTGGTKASLAWLTWKTTGNLDAVRGIGIDAAVMNTEDVGCVGAVKNLLLSQTISKNTFIVPGEVVKTIIQSTNEFCKMLCQWGCECELACGETASVGDNVRALEVGSSVSVRMKKKYVIDASHMSPGNFLVGFSSTGQAMWEHPWGENSGIGDNGLTNARHDSLCPSYRKFTETFAPQMRRGLVYRGKYKLTDQLPQDPRFTIAGALLSPTRTYLPLIRKILQEVGHRHIRGIIHCTGGGQTKIAKFGAHGCRFVIHSPFDIPPVFQMLHEVSGLSWKEMYETYNMGWRLVMAVPDKKVAEDCIDISHQHCVDAQIVGEVRSRLGPGPNKVVIHSPHGTLRY